MLRVIDLLIRIANRFNPIKTKVDKIADYPIGTGETNGWTYCKWNSGKYEAWLVLRNGWSNGVIVSKALPIIFAEQPILIPASNYNSADGACRATPQIFESVAGKGFDKCHIYGRNATNGNSTSNQNGVSLYLIGRWK